MDAAGGWSMRYSVVLWKDLIAGERVALWIVGGYSVWVAERLEQRVVVWLVVLDQILHISLGEVSNQSILHILNLSGHDLVLVVISRLIDESLVEEGLHEQIELAHESSIVSVLVLLEKGSQLQVSLVTDGVINILWHHSQVVEEFGCRTEGNTPHE